MPDLNYVRASYLASTYGLSARQWTRMAAEGKIPGARQPTGEGGVWLFDLAAFKRWWGSQIKVVASWPGYSSGARSGGDALKEAAKNLGSPSRRDLKRSLESALQNGSGR